MSTITCTQCNQIVEASDKFCQHCGAPILQTTNPGSNSTASKPSKTITSSGNYSGTMIKGKGSRTRKTIRNIVIGFVLIGIIALIIWFQIDPDAGEKLTNIIVGLLIMVVFGFFIYRSSQKGKGRKRSFRSGNNRDDDRNHDDDDNNDDNYDDDDDGDDDD